MTNNQRREVIKHRVEHVVSTSPPWGATLKDVNLAIHHALEEVKARGGGAYWDDALRFTVGDDEIVIFYEYDEPVID